MEYVALLISVAFGLVNICFSLQFQLHGLDMKVAGVFDTVTGLSLLECATYSEIKENTKAFNHMKDGKLCEVSSLVPDGSLIISTGWNVYVTIGNLVFIKYFMLVYICSFATP